MCLPLSNGVGDNYPDFRYDNIMKKEDFLNSEEQGSLVCYSSLGSQRVRQNFSTEQPPPAFKFMIDFFNPKHVCWVPALCQMLSRCFRYICVCVRLWKSLSRVQLFVTPWTIQSVEFSRPENWSGQAVPFSRGSSQPRDQTQVSYITGGLTK